jgi:NADPH:quinone reductase-like Zn-dependent oxidoreductase
MDALATGGRMVHIATLGGRRVELDLRQLMGKRARLIGSTLRARPVPEKERLQLALLQRFGQAMKSGRLKPLIDAVYPWQRVNEAHGRMRANRPIGKLVLQVEGTDAALSGGG